MSILSWILVSTIAMSLFSLVGVLTFFLNDRVLRIMLFPLVAFSAGALLGGAFLHMIPEALEVTVNSKKVFIWVLIGFAAFFLMEQFINWHHCHEAPCDHTKPVTYLILIADGVHNFLGGLAIAGAFLVDIRLGIVTWLVEASHEIPQELGDFGILIHGGWSKAKALLFNLLSGLTMVLGAVLAYYLSARIDVVFLLPFAAGNFIYIAASDLIPEIKHSEKMKHNLFHFAAFLSGLLLIYGFSFIE
jgi:zinc and cadmium transporter